MVLYPTCQAKAQEEIDTIIDSGRLPEFSDRPSLPYLECIVQETLRFAHLSASYKLLIVIPQMDASRSAWFGD